MKQHYTIEALEERNDGISHWYILGSDDSSTWAQHSMASYRKLFPNLPLRVVERPSGLLVLLNDPRKHC